MWIGCNFRRWVAAWVALAGGAFAGPYAPAAGRAGSDAVPKDDPRIIAWASSVASLVRGPEAIFDDFYGKPTNGSLTDALGPADVDLSRPDPYTTPAVSLGDGGRITLNFTEPIHNGLGPDLAVFENSFSDTFLELAFVSVSSDGITFVKFPSVSLTPTAGLVEDTDRDDFSELDPTNLYNLAGKYRGGFGTPFDLQQLAGIPGLDIDRIIAVRIDDVVGSINEQQGWARHDSLGHIIKDPFPTVFATGGFDLDAVAVLRGVPEPSSAACLLAAGPVLWFMRRRR